MDYLSHIESETARVAGLIRGADPDTPVPTCPGWRLDDVVVHIGTMHHWVTHILTNRVQERIWSRQVPNGLAEGQRGDAEWLAAGLAGMLAAMRATDPDTPLWTWGPGKRAAWWPPRMLFELVIHRVDVELALGITPEIDIATAVDGVAEFLENLSHAAWVTGPLAELGVEGATIHLHATDTHDGEWTLTQGPSGTITWSRGHAKGDTAVRGSAADLLLMLYGRRSPGALTVFGDRDLLDRWLAAVNL
ncbi:maleylpyruvate isomerase family mycothiol-dependent enzyme [Nonomuraea sp. NN258]|uniref:maleylpyruvate isomerase family mycothiol-dependent enzyme n=1 Tax=Nonomuraea antri TaxID=2730852 RepID=UPI00156A170F|nr:maleylpyruvate isomerase family mycothiol-dependent enzyme [Nonomuraea antri]NRQ31103.1 maleylpyruvate isomerase family mycothiol-dependent enzyme [Nonomuraea antri]